jgi:pimeloyl-ACP methyl ester carboxylesterase
MTEVRTVDFPLGAMRFKVDQAGPAEGDPVLLLHGFPQTRHTWREQLPALAGGGFWAVAPDQRGYSPGARPAAVEDYATDRLVADAVALARYLAGSGDRQVHLVGHDWGGQIAWLTAAHHPEVVRSLTVLSRPHPAAFAAAFDQDPGQADRSRHHRAFHDPATADLLLADDARRLRRLLVGNGVPAGAASAYLSVLGDRAALDAALNWYRATPPEGLRAAATPPVLAPTLYLWGTDDHSVGSVAAELTAAHVGGPYRFVAIPGAGHFLTDDHAGPTVTAELLAHLAAH